MFDRKTPIQELKACCLWEYARESQEIQDVLRKYNHLESQSKKTNGPQSIHYGMDFFKIQHCGVWTTMFMRSRSGFPLAWQSLSESKQKQAAEWVVDNKEVFHNVPVKLGRVEHAKWLADKLDGFTSSFRPYIDHWITRCKEELNAPELDQFVTQQCEMIVNETNPENREHMANGFMSWLTGRCGLTGPLRLPWPPPGPLRPGWSFDTIGETLLLEVDWREFTDTDIVDYFKKNIRRFRPFGIKPDHGNSDLRKSWNARLRHLTILRLIRNPRNAETFLNDHRDITDFPQFRGNRWFAASKWVDAIAEANTALHKLFPFIPPDVRPLSMGK